MRALSRLALLPPAAAVALALALAAILAWVDYLVGIEISFSIFYLLPIFLAAWMADWRGGLPVAVVCAILWLLNDHFLGGHVYSSPAIPYWNALVRLGFFVLFIWLLGQLRAALRRESAQSRTMSEMLSLVSHEFNNGLTSLSVSLQLLRRFHQPSPDEARLYAIMDGAQRRLMQTVANFLNQARMQADSFRLALRPTVVRQLVGESVDILEPISQQKGVELRVEVPPEIHHAKADPDALAVVITNLISNAVKYTPSGGSVTVRLEKKDARLEVAVSDTGIGIAEEEKQRIMEGFYRTQQGREVARGYGIGLRLSVDLLRAHGSELQVESTHGRGSRVSFQLPICEEKS